MKRQITVLETAAIAGIFLEGLLAAFILSAVRDFDAEALLGSGGIAVAGVLLGFVSREFAATAVMARSLALAAAISLVLVAVASPDNAVVVIALGVVFVCSAEVTRFVLPFVSIEGMR